MVHEQASGIYLHKAGCNSIQHWDYDSWASWAQMIKHWARWDDLGLQFGLTLSQRLRAAGVRGRAVRLSVAGFGQ